MLFRSDRIQVSEATRRLLGDDFSFESRGTILIKGKGKMRTHFLTGRKFRTPLRTPEVGSNTGSHAGGAPVKVTVEDALP